MPHSGTPKLSPAPLRKAYKQHLAGAWAMARQKHPDHTPYAFVLYGVEGGEPPQFTPAVLTEESLTRVAQRYLNDGYHDTLDEARAALRYSVADSPFGSEMEGCTPTVDSVVEPFAKILDDDTGYALLAKAAMAALKELDSEGLFGTGAERERLLLAIITEDTPKDWSKESARKLNPPRVFARFEAETKIEGAYASSIAMAIAPDGRSIYSAGSRSNPAGKPGSPNEFISEIIGYDVRGPRLAVRWTFEHPGVGDFVRKLTVAPDSRSVIALRVQDSTTLLMRLPYEKGEPVQEARLPDDPGNLAMSADGSRLAFTTEGTIRLLDTKEFRVLHTRDLEANLAGLLFLRNGDLLVGTETAILRLNPADDRPPIVAARLRAVNLVADANETLLAVGRWPGITREERENPKPFGITLLSLPSFQIIRTILIPQRQAVMPSLSPDGRLLAFEAHEIGRPPIFVAVFDTETGKEIARRKSSCARALAFLPGNRTLAIAGSGIRTTPPIDLWTIPQE